MLPAARFRPRPQRGGLSSLLSALALPSLLILPLLQRVATRRAPFLGLALCLVVALAVTLTLAAPAPDPVLAGNAPPHHGHLAPAQPDGDAGNDGNASVQPSPSAQSVTLTVTQHAFYTDRATLTIANHTGNWYFKSNGDRYATCSSSPVTGKTWLVGLLTGGATYTFSAYSDSGCTTANLLATASPFTAQPVSLRALTEIETRGFLLGGGMGSTWYYKADAAPYNADCYSSTAGKRLTHLRPNTPYTFSAYSDSACTPANRLVTAETFTIRQLEPLPQCDGIAIRQEFEAGTGSHHQGPFGCSYFQRNRQSYPEC